MSKALSDDKSSRAFVGSHCHAIPRSGHVPRGNDLTLPLTGYSGFRCPPKMHCRYQSASEIFGSGLNKSLVKGVTSLSRSDYTRKTQTAHRIYLCARLLYSVKWFAVSASGLGCWTDRDRNY